jgi:hypothetical protein
MPDLQGHSCRKNKLVYLSFSVLSSTLDSNYFHALLSHSIWASYITQPFHSCSGFEGMCFNHNVSDQLIQYHEAVAAGGVGMTTVAYAAVTKSGLSFPHQLWLREEIIPELRKLTDAVHRHNAKASIQIGHCGNMAKA